jgi:hypothetical protein
MPLGLLINFGSPNNLEWKRLVANEPTIYRINQLKKSIRED